MVRLSNSILLIVCQFNWMTTLKIKKLFQGWGGEQYSSCRRRRGVKVPPPVGDGPPISSWRSALQRKEKDFFPDWRLVYTKTSARGVEGLV